MSRLWVEGQVVQLQPSQRRSTCFLTLRDTDVDMSLTVTIPRAMPSTPARSRCADGAAGRRPRQARRSGRTRHAPARRPPRSARSAIGELLARLEQLKRVLAAEGLFDPDRKRRLPFLPRAVGLVCGRGSAAERDVVENARRRWPAVRFEIREVRRAGRDGGRRGDARRCAELDALTAGRRHRHRPRAAARSRTCCRSPTRRWSGRSRRARTPVVSAIGHESDTPLLDLVADVRASTPTDAARRVVPDVAEERAGLDDARQRLTRAVGGRLAAERRHLESVRSRPILRDPGAMLAPHRTHLGALRQRAAMTLLARTHRAADEVEHLRARVRALSPLATLQRGYCVVEHADGHLVTARGDVRAGELLRVRVSDGDFGARVVG